jgi:hypothetical protein
VVKNIVKGVESLLNLPCKRKMERTCRRTTKGLEQKGFAKEDKPLKWTNGIASCKV